MKLVVRNEQMSVFSQYMVRQYESRVMAYIHATYPQFAQEKGYSYLQSLIRSGIEKAAEYEIYAEDDVQCFIDCLIIFGEDFDTNSCLAWSAAILGDKGIAGDEKARQLRKQLDQSMEVR